jgi:hypothetical protein
MTTADAGVSPPGGAVESCARYNVVLAGPHTSCPFANAVAKAFFSLGQSGSGNAPIAVTAMSTVTGKTYVMQCTPATPSTPNICTGAVGASVIFP